LYSNGGNTFKYSWKRPSFVITHRKARVFNKFIVYDFLLREKILERFLIYQIKT